MNTDPRKSTTYCGCDEAAGWVCERHKGGQMAGSVIGEMAAVNRFDGRPGVNNRWEPKTHGLFPDSAQGRKDHPVFSGVLMYFPDALAAVAHVSKVGNDQHNPGQPLHWAREKSTDQMDTATRHMMDHGTGAVRDTDGEYHLAKAAWRILAELQLTIEREKNAS